MKTLRVLKEVFISSLPLAAIIILVTVFIAPMGNPADYLKLLVGYACVVVGQVILLVGLDESILPIGKLVGKSLIRLKKVAFIILFGFLFGVLATVAEPNASVLARQTDLIFDAVNETAFVWVTGFGIGVFVGLALFRILKDINIKIIFASLYILIFITAIFVPKEFIALAFDGSGAATGGVSVPFILAMGVGVSMTMSKRKTSDDTFGIIGIASTGPILAVFVYGIILRALSGGTVPMADYYNPGATEGFLSVVVSNLGSMALALFPVVIVFLPFQFFLIRLPRREFLRILLGTVPVYVGLVIFISGIDYGLAYTGKYIGEVFLDPARPPWFQYLLLGILFILGAAITLSEPVVTVLGEQLEEITNGHIKKLTIRLTLAVGTGFAAVMAVVKTITQIHIIWFIVPLYILAVIMMKANSPLFVGLAFDSGGVASGMLTSAFLTPLTLGVAQAVARNAGGNAQSVLSNGFGIISFFAVTPMIAVQTLGMVYERRLKKIQKQAMEDELAGLEELAHAGELPDEGEAPLHAADLSAEAAVAAETSSVSREPPAKTEAPEVNPPAQTDIPPENGRESVSPEEKSHET